MPNTTKEQVHAWMTKRAHDHKPLPDRETIRRELGWQLEEANQPVYHPEPPQVSGYF